MSSTLYDLRARLRVLSRELGACASDMLDANHGPDFSQHDQFALDLAAMASAVSRMASDIRPSEAA